MFMQVRIDHSTKSLCFGTDMNFSHHLDSPEGPHAQVSMMGITWNLAETTYVVEAILY